MAITSLPQDKYAFLFTGPTQEVYLQDLLKVFEVLTSYYNYPPANITVVLGSIPAVMPSFPGATVTTITLVAELDGALATFAAAASGPVPGGWKTALLYFTGGGDQSDTVSRLVIDGGPATNGNTVDPAWLTARLNAFSDCHVNVVMQQSFSGGFLSALTGSTLGQWSFTHACSDTQTSFGNNTDGSFFTYGWVKGLKFEALPAGTPHAGQYADVLGAMGEATNHLISLEEAQEFGKEVHDVLGFGPFSTPGYAEGGGPQYLGLPSFLIRDGSPWYESPDIHLTHPNHPWVPAGDLYIPDALGAMPPYNNTIEATTRNVGTHPVRAYSLGIELFKSGTGVTNEPHTACERIPAGGLLLPVDPADIGTPGDKVDTYAWNTPFTLGTTHECVKAEAKLLCGDVDFVWSVTANDFEGQRNTDEMTVVPPPPAPKALPLLNIQGWRLHRYSFRNRFDKTRRFILVFPEAYRKYQEVLGLEWFDRPWQPNADVVPLKVVEKPVPHIPFRLKAGETQDLFLRVRVKPGFRRVEEIRLPFELLVEGEWPGERLRPVTAAIPKGYAPIAGINVVIQIGAATLQGVVLDREGKPLPEARVLLRTVDDLQGSVLTADGKGRFVFQDINPDVYYLWAERGQWRSKRQTVVLLSGMKAELKVAV